MVGGAVLPSRVAHEDARAISEGNFPSGYRDWSLISVAREEGELDDIRAILGNDRAIKTYRTGTRPFPEGVHRRAPEKRCSVHSQGLDQVRLDRRLE